MDTVRVPAEDRRQIATVIGGREYKFRNGFAEMPAHAARLHMADAGYGSSWAVKGSIADSRSGYQCQACGFASYFRTCSRCGAQCERPTSTVED